MYTEYVFMCGYSAIPLYNTATPLFQDDGSPVSVFSLSGSNAQDGHLAAARNGVKRLRTVSFVIFEFLLFFFFFLVWNCGLRGFDRALWCWFSG